MDREPAAVVEFEDDQFEEVAGPICAEHERPARLIVSLLKRETCDRVTNGVNNVRVGDPVFPCGAMDIHTRIIVSQKYEARRVPALACTQGRGGR
jgi:hypothetical protein